MLNKGYSVSFKDNFCTIYDANGVEIVRIKMVDNSFPLSCHVYVSKVDVSMLWHNVWAFQYEIIEVYAITNYDQGNIRKYMSVMIFVKVVSWGNNIERLFLLIKLRGLNRNCNWFILIYVDQ